MSINLLTLVQEKLQYQPLQKIDANTQAVAENNKTPNEEKFSQAAIPAVILALYKFSTTADGAASIINSAVTKDWVTIVFKDNTDEFFENIASYSYESIADVATKVRIIFNTAIDILKNYNSGAEVTAHTIQKLLADQRSLTLPYLPAEIRLGTLLNDASIDDRTHKMEGPVSNLMHAIGNIFSSSDDEKTVR